MKKENLLKTPVEHIDISEFNSRPIIKSFKKTAIQARNLSRACEICETMVSDPRCTVVLCLSGSLFSAGLKNVVIEMVKKNMVDAIVSTGAIIVDQDFFEGLGFKHYQGTPFIDDSVLQELMIDRIYDTYIDEEELRICDMTIAEIANEMAPGAYSSREFIREMGHYLEKRGAKTPTLTLEAFRKNVPIFVPAFSDCSAGFGLVHHQFNRKEGKVHIDSAKDFLELTKVKMKASETGLLMVGGGVPKNFAQDMTVAVEILGKETSMHKYAVQITVADERDGALSGSTLKEAHSWGKVDTGFEQMVWSEATIALPLLASYLYHGDAWKGRKDKELGKFLDE